METKKIKRFVLEVPADYHSNLKARAAHRNMTITAYVKQALDEMIVRDSNYGENPEQ